jgi:ZU5 domain
MRLRSFTTLAVAVAATFIASGCANDGPAAPRSEAPAPQAPQAPDASLLGLLGSALGGSKTITPALRSTPLPTNVTVSKTIGILGGTLVIPQAGVTIVVPPLAVARPTKFSVTARAGAALAYDFEPHGTKFTLPLIMTQSLRGVKTNQGLLNLGLSLGYYPDNNKPTSVTELLNVNVDLLNLTAVSTIWHFSGYIYASGRESDGGEGF